MNGIEIVQHCRLFTHVLIVTCRCAVKSLENTISLVTTVRKLVWITVSLCILGFPAENLLKLVNPLIVKLAESGFCLLV